MPEPAASITFDEIKHLVGRSDPTILDIGANNGNTSASFLRTFPEAKLYAFEPDPRAIEKYQRRLAGTTATLTQIALGDADGTATFHMSDSKDPNAAQSHDKSGSLLRPTGHIARYRGVAFNRTIEVKVLRLDQWTNDAGIDHIDFIWADVQGAEQKLIVGGIETLKRTRFFYTEYSDTELYAGQPNLEKIKEMLPFMDVISLYRDDALFINRKHPSNANFKDQVSHA